MLTKMLRTEGALRGILSTKDLNDESLIAKAKSSPSMNGLDLAKVVTCKEKYFWNEIDKTPFALEIKKEKLRTKKFLMLWFTILELNKIFYDDLQLMVAI